ncbi:unnamed protein product [Lepeophtheirus salmonis]|uniref:(salmon louse) hypothetical protein n=1 Tax=Lepeophtheirus salmonis TaxID=72036 RepID=A0A7R8H5X5_LEPSM|nr:unnamed protein product [Lepeophtheirus salmonis]CAF2871288.1 unnamed protein product [Lepeophtheirus salmonis]
MTYSSHKLHYATTTEDFIHHREKSSGVKSGEEGGHISLDKNRAILSLQNFWHLADPLQDGVPEHLIVGVLADFLPILEKERRHIFPIKDNNTKDCCLVPIFGMVNPLDLFFYFPQASSSCGSCGIDQLLLAFMPSVRRWCVVLVKGTNPKLYFIPLLMVLGATEKSLVKQFIDLVGYS